MVSEQRQGRRSINCSLTDWLMDGSTYHVSQDDVRIGDITVILGNGVVGTETVEGGTIIVDVNELGETSFLVFELWIHDLEEHRGVLFACMDVLDRGPFLVCVGE